MKNFAFLLIFAMSFGLLSAQGLETFDNFTATGSSYSNGTFTGQDGSLWTYTQCRGDYEITGKAIMIGRNREPQSNFYSGTILNGIGTLSFDYMQAFSTNVNLNVLINDVVVGNVTSSGEPGVIKNSGVIDVNLNSDFVIKFINANNGDGQVVVDNVSWTAFNPNMVATPDFSYPAGQYFNAIDVEITCETPDASIYYTTDGTDPTTSSTIYTEPITIATSTTLKARAYAAGLDPSSIAQAVYTINTVIEVATLADLRAAYPSTDHFKVTGEVVLTFQQAFRNQKYIQDATAAILIDDNSGIITSAYNTGDGITGIIGTVTEYGQMLQFVPAFDPGAATSSGNQITPQVITIEELNNNFEDYEAELVKIADAVFADAGAIFENGQVYQISDNSKATGDFRTTFWDVDYIGTTIPSGPGSIIGLPNSREEGNYISSRSLADLEWSFGEPSNYPTAFQATPVNTSVKLTWEDATGEILPSGYLLLASDEDNIVAPTDGISVANDTDLSDGDGAMNISYGTEEFDFTDLQNNVTYYFKIFSYAGGGSAIDYKTDGTPPAAQATIVVTIKPEPTNYPTDFTASANATNITIQWTDATGEVLPDGYLILAGNQNNFQYPVDATPVEDDTNLSDGNGAMNIAQGVQTFSFSGLEQQTTYYFMIFPYTNSGENLDYKTDGTPPATETITGTIQIITVLNTTFNDSWQDWLRVSVTGNEEWDRDNTYGIDGTACARMSGYANSQSNPNEDWLISPALNLSNTSNEKLTFFSAVGYTGPSMALKISTDYDGSGDPGNFTWTDLSDQVTWPTGEPYWEWTESGEINISSFGEATAYIAFVYTSTAAESATWEVDNIEVTGEESNSIPSIENTIHASIYPNPGNGLLNIRIHQPASLLEVLTLTGQLMYQQAINHDQLTIDLRHLSKGVYFLKLNDANTGIYSTTKIIIN